MHSLSGTYASHSLTLDVDLLAIYFAERSVSQHRNPGVVFRSPATATLRLMYYSCARAQTLAVRFGLGRGSRLLRSAIEGFLDLDPVYETIVRDDPNHALA